MADDDKKSTLDQFRKDLEEQLKIDAASFGKVFDDLSKAANEVNKIFTQGRQRISELRTALADAGPDVLRLGGELEDVGRIIGDVAEESRRNVVATSEQVEKLYAAQRVLGLSAGELTKAFLDIGAGIETIPKTLEESVQYIQSIGGNAKTVMRSVSDNMEQMNRYQFEGGVIGLTKMAAQASMLRFDMSQTFQLAEKVLDPDKAVEVASSFQRLGVAAGIMGDPFALMNASINDPGALQDSLVDVAKQFTYFDEKTKTFKINPQGVLTLKELQEQTGVSSKEMAKLGLAAAEADMRISAIGAAGLNIKEEDKQYLANIARMGEGGQYEVKLRDEAGIEQTRKLSEITQDEFNKLIKEQREGPKTLEDIARAQMSTSDVIMNDVRAIRNKFVGGIVTAGQTQELIEGGRRAATLVTGATSKSFDAQDVRRETQTAMGDLGKFISDLQNKNIPTTTAIQQYLEKAGNQLGSIEEKFKNTLTKTAEEIRKNSSDKTAVERLMKEGFEFVSNKLESKQTTKQQSAGSQTLSSLIEGRSSQVKQAYSSSTKQVGGGKSQIEVAGGMKIDINFNGNTSNFTPEQMQVITKTIVDKLNSQEVAEFFRSSAKGKNPFGSNTINPVGP